MVDKIGGNKGFGPLDGIKRSGKAQVAKQGGDKVSFSNVLQEAGKAQAASATQETARAEKIQALKAQIENGTYQPDLEKVASSLLPFILKDI